MAVVTKYSQAHPDPATNARPKGIDAAGRVNGAIATIAVANGDSANSKLFIAKVPSWARILPISTVRHSAITSLNDLDIGTDEDPDGLADGLDVSSAGTKSLVAAVAVGNLHKRLWELLGLTKDPVKELSVYATMKAGATAAGTIQFELYFATEN